MGNDRVALGVNTYMKTFKEYLEENIDRRTPIYHTVESYTNKHEYWKKVAPKRYKLLAYTYIFPARPDEEYYRIPQKNVFINKKQFSAVNKKVVETLTDEEFQERMFLNRL